MISRFELVEEKYKVGDYPVSLPRRATDGSAGYDFFATEDITLIPGRPKFKQTNVKAFLPKQSEMQLRPRSSLGKLGMEVLSDTIDEDYVDNEKTGGNIGFRLYLRLGFDPIVIRKGERIIQGVISPYLILDKEEKPIDSKRVGGEGSSGKEVK